MKHQSLPFTIEPMKPRNRVAEDMFDRSVPYKPKRVKSEIQYHRRQKYRNRQEF